MANSPQECQNLTKTVAIAYYVREPTDGRNLDIGKYLGLQ